MTPDLRSLNITTSTTSYNFNVVDCRPYTAYSRTSYKSYEYENTTSTCVYWSHKDKYAVSYTETLIYVSTEAQKNIKKLLKRMAKTLCKEGWIEHITFYKDPQYIPVNLRGVRLEGRGWVNKN